MAVSGTTELKILFGEAWLFGLTRQRLLGEIPFARDGNSLCCFGTSYAATSDADTSLPGPFIAAGSFDTNLLA